MKKTASKSLIPSIQIEQCIHIIRGYRVMLDKDLAMLYQVSTKRLNEQVQRNIGRFPADFAFQLNPDEWNFLRSQIATSKVGKGGRRYLPYAFTEQGVAMLSSVLRSPQAIMINVEIMRAFVKMRQIMTSQVQISKELTDIRSFLLKHSNSNDREFRRVWQAIEKLSSPPDQKRGQIGFDLS